MAPATSQARERTFTLRYGPVTLGGFETQYPQGRVHTPQRPGYITRTSARIVDAR